MAKAAPRLQSRQGAWNCGRVRECGLRTESRPTGCEAQRRDGNGSIAARTGHFCLPLVRGALGVPDEQSRPGPWPMGTGSGREPFAHLSVAPQPNSGAAIGADVPADSFLVWFRHTKRAGPAQRPALSGQRVFFGPRIELKGSDRETPAKWASEWLHGPPRSILQALPFADIKRPAFESSPTSTKIAGGPATARLGCCPRELLAPPPVFFVRTRRLLGDEEAPRGGHFSLPEASGRFRAIAIAMEHRKPRKKVVGDDG